MVGTKLKSVTPERVDRLNQAAGETSRQTLAIRVDAWAEHKRSRVSRVPNAPSGSIDCSDTDCSDTDCSDTDWADTDCVEDAPISRECVCDREVISESILHDLRNPLAAIHVAAEMILDADLPPARVTRLARNIYRASRRIQGLLQDLLNVSRGEISAPQISSLREIAVAACESLSGSAESCGTTLAVGIRPEIEVPLERGRMQRAFVNLIANAIEAMPRGGEVSISAELVAESVVVHVDDTGPGIAPEIRPELFRPFVTARKHDGLGLGLAFTRQTVLDHGGDIWVGSAPGGGARFSLRLPGAHVVRMQTGTV
jgi:K+-sensing histidine kinase KdpD